jgi:YebC/PmpR family DNA-binding regulatory protein
MAGHSKWSQIKRKKAITDGKRGQSFTKLIKEISICARLGGGDPAGNARLRFLMEKAKQINMPLENTMRAIKRGTGELPGVNYEQITYEGHGPGNIAIIVDTLTDNKNRTVGELRHLFSAKGGRLADSGSVSWMFEKYGAIRMPANGKSEDDLLEALLDFDISDIKKEDDILVVFCDVKNMEPIKDKLKEIGMTFESAEPEWVAKTTMSLPDGESDSAYDFLSALEDHEDVKNVFTNLN